MAIEEAGSIGNTGPARLTIERSDAAQVGSGAAAMGRFAGRSVVVLPGSRAGTEPASSVFAGKREPVLTPLEQRAAKVVL